MMECIFTIVLGLIFIIIGISHTRGNISLLHSYHRKRVLEEDKIPFGKKVGLGTIIVGFTLILFSILNVITIYTKIETYSLIGNILLVIGMAIGLIISLAAIKKYNKGIF